MIRQLIFILLLVSSCTSGQNSSTEASLTKPKVLIDAEKMIAAFIRKDFRTYSDFVYPLLIERQGGKEKFIRALEEAKLFQGDSLHNIQLSNPSKAIECNGVLQCSLKETTTMSFGNDKPISFSSNLIGFSSDLGKSWTFLNVSDKSILEIQKEFPTVCDSLDLSKLK